MARLWPSPLPLSRWSPAALSLALFTCVQSAAGAVPVEQPEIVAAYPHDPGAFTQGLLLHGGRFFESTGLHGRSSLREVAPATGAVVRRVDLDREFFAEGLARVGQQLIQLTWRNQVAHVYDLKTLKRTKEFPYQGEGWGLCFDGKRLVMSDGSGSLFFRDPTTFRITGELSVTVDGKSTTHLNELECVGSLIYANVWQTSEILRIDSTTGKVLTRIDAGKLVEQQLGADVLNGIAYDPSTEHFFITGKLWPKIYEANFNFSPGGAVDSSTVAPATDSSASPTATRGDAAAGAPNTQKKNSGEGNSRSEEAGKQKKAPEPSREAGKQKTVDTRACNCRAAGAPGHVQWWVPLLSLAGCFLRRRA